MTKSIEYIIADIMKNPVLYEIETLGISEPGKPTLYNYNEVIRHLLVNYPSWLYGYPTHILSLNLETLTENFLKTFDSWKHRNYNSFKKLYDAWESEYNALENYDRKEEGTVTDEHHKGTKTSTETDIKQTGKQKEKSKLTDSTNAFNGGMVPTSETQGNESDNETNTESTAKGSASSNYTKVEDIDGTHFDKDVRTFGNYRVHGNIGVTSNAQLLDGEKSLRTKNDLLKSILDMFIGEYCFYVGGFENENESE